MRRVPPVGGLNEDKNAKPDKAHLPVRRHPSCASRYKHAALIRPRRSTAGAIPKYSAVRPAGRSIATSSRRRTTTEHSQHSPPWNRCRPVDSTTVRAKPGDVRASGPDSCTKTGLPAPPGWRLPNRRDRHQRRNLPGVARKQRTRRGRELPHEPALPSPCSRSGTPPASRSRKENAAPSPGQPGMRSSTQILPP